MDNLPLWDMDGPGVTQWVQSTSALLPKSVVAKLDPAARVTKMAIAQRLLTNLVTAIAAALPVTTGTSGNGNGSNGTSSSSSNGIDRAVDHTDNGNNGGAPPPAKRIKTEGGSYRNVVTTSTSISTTDPAGTLPQKSSSVTAITSDPFRVWFGATDELSKTVGGILVELSLAGFLNGMAGKRGGLVDEKTLLLSPIATTPATTATATTATAVPNHVVSTSSTTDPIPTAGNITFAVLRNYAIAIRRAVTTRAERDVLTTTPLRIAQMLCPEADKDEFKSIRKRVYDTVILGKGMVAAQQERNGGNGSNDDDDNKYDLPVAARSQVHDVEKFKKCKVCGQNDQSFFVLDRKNGDVICTTCGTVATESIMHEGSQFRKFEGEVDRNHHGDAANPLYSNAHNMSTTLGGVAATTGAGKEGFGTQKRGLETILKNAHAYTEMNISQFGKGERKTREGYKDRQKRDAFIQMAHVGDALNLHEAVVQRSKELFAGFRDDRELVQQFKGVIAACLCEAFDQLSRDGQRILKSMEQEYADAIEEELNDPNQPCGPSNARASRRSELHSAKMAGKGGMNLDFEDLKSKKGMQDRDGNYIVKQETAETAPTIASATEHKLVPLWDLDDCRSWLLEASRSIARQWVDERRKNGANPNKQQNGSTSTSSSNSKNIPNGTLEELEGQLVEHTLSLCDQLEANMSGSNEGTAAAGSRRAVVTPRVQGGMGSLSIKWQHAHERGSGGKGGVGHSGVRMAGRGKPGDRNNRPKNSRTAGQILILKTEKKLGAMLKDPVAGDAFHKELRALVGRQEARKRKLQRDEAARQRFQQMKRKPWLLAKVADAAA